MTHIKYSNSQNPIDGSSLSQLHLPETETPNINLSVQNKSNALHHHYTNPQTQSQVLEPDLRDYFFNVSSKFETKAVELIDHTVPGGYQYFSREWTPFTNDYVLTGIIASGIYGFKFLKHTCEKIGDFISKHM